MRKTQELETIQIIFLSLSRKQKEELLANSNLNNREIELLSLRLIDGKSLKECADYFGIEEDSVNKAQHRAVKKLYLFISLKK